MIFLKGVICLNVTFFNPQNISTDFNLINMMICNAQALSKSLVQDILESEKIYIYIFKPYLFSVGHTGTTIKTLTEKVEKTVSNHRNVNKPAGGINVAEAFIKKELKEELKVKSHLLANHTERFIF